MTSMTLEGVTQVTLPLDRATSRTLSIIHDALARKQGVDATPISIIKAAVRLAAEMEGE